MSSGRIPPSELRVFDDAYGVCALPQGHRIEVLCIPRSCGDLRGLVVMKGVAACYGIGMGRMRPDKGLEWFAHAFG